MTEPTAPGKRLGVAAAIAAAIAVPAEGIRQVAYYDPPGILTVCRGHTGPDVVKGRVYSFAECDSFLNADMKAAVAKVDSCVPGLPVNVLAAFSDAVYNMGPKIACDTTRSTAARLLQQQRFVEACNQLTRWDKASVAGVMVALPGLTKRRALDRDVCLTPSTP